MKYGIINSAEETSCDKRDNEGETDMASENECTSATATMAIQRRQSDVDAVIFSIQFYGKTIGEVGLMDQDLSELDWKKFKSYLFQNLLSVNQQENICVKYSDEEGDKLPIDSDEEYREALKVAKKKAEMHDKLVLDITRQGGFPAVLSMVSSGIKKVSSSPPKEGGISFFKASSPPKDNSGFKAVGTERKLFQGLFMPDKGPIPGHVQGMWGYDCDEALECGKVNTTSTTTTTTTTTSPVPTARSDCKRGPPVRALRSSPPNLLFNFEVPTHNVSPTLETPACQDVFGSGIDKLTGARPKDGRLKGEMSEQPPEWFTSYMKKFRAEVCEEISECVLSKVTEALKNSDWYPRPRNPTETIGYELERLITDGIEASERSGRNLFGLRSYIGTANEGVHEETKKQEEDGENAELKFETLYMERTRGKKKDAANEGAHEETKKQEEDGENAELKFETLHMERTRGKKKVAANEGVHEETKKQEEDGENAELKFETLHMERTRGKKKDAANEGAHEETKKQEEDGENAELKFGTLHMERTMGKKKDDKCIGVKRKKFIKEEERLVKEEGRLLKRQEKIEKRKSILTSKYADEMDRAGRTQEKVFAKMEGLRKKQFCSQEEFSKLRKMVDKQQRFMSAEQRQQRRSERKAGYQKYGKARKINIDNKCFPVDASLLHKALLELEALAEDSTSDCAGGAITRGYDALYLRDMTYPDGSVVPPGKDFVKTWRVVNNGVMTWNEKTTLCKWTQVRFRGSPAGWKLKPSMKRVVCPPLDPGQEGDISIAFTAPSEPGWYATHWRFCQRGRVFGNQMWCAIRVEEEPIVSAEPEPQLDQVVVNDLPATVLHQGLPEVLFDNYSSDDPDSSNVITSPKEELGPQNDLGIVENYYDAEDPVQRDCIESLQNLTLTCPAEPDESKEEKNEKDLITFEEEAEVIDSGLSTPELLPSVSQMQVVVPLKEMAKESVENLIHKDQEIKSPLKEADTSFNNQSDSISMSSGSFSEIDSEDQAILNESDSEGSDHEYYVVQLPECFNTNSLLEASESNKNESDSGENPVVWQEEFDRPESPDFLTADEDDRTTAVASDSSEDLTCPVNEPSYDSSSSSVSQASGSTNPENTQNKSQVQKGNSSSLPDPPTDTKPFMVIPNEALQTNLLYSASQSKSGDQARKDQDPGTWASGANCQRRVVCEQPYSSQHKETKHSGLSCDGVTSAQAESTTSSTIKQMPVDLVGALPDELEMLSPTSESPGRVYSCEEESAAEAPEPAQTLPGPDAETRTEESVSEISNPANIAKEASPPLAPPLQQLEDMGFHNREVNERLLTKYNGDVSCAVAELIILNCH
ncbi:uncharacterized protein [Palaemon carinicauda]|uniref:uncharacterized protein isoform X2 n=1 Tax=Palaemon carinicauda TaxID=392227 RepID=UPI0035B69C32